MTSLRRTRPHEADPPELAELKRPPADVTGPPTTSRAGGLADAAGWTSLVGDSA